MNLLPPDKLDAIEKCFGEGRGVRETARLVEVHRDTVSRYFRLLSEPAHDPVEPGGPDAANFEVVEHAHDWHVFCWHDDTPEWWRHIASFHIEQRARDYASECASRSDFAAADPQEAAEVGWPEADAAAAPETLPAPPTAPAEAETRTLTREERAAERERRWDEAAALLPERRCSICDAVLVRRPGEPSLNFSIRKTCSAEHATAAIQRAREARKAVVDNESLPIEPADQPSVTPPGYRDCPDCVWSGPIKEYRDHRSANHG